MSTTASFVSFLALTVVLLAAVVVTGKRAQRRIHLTCVLATLASLGTTIYFAEKLGELYDLESAGMITLHLFVAKVTTVAYLLPVFTGVRTWRDATWRSRHRFCAYLVVALTVATAVTGSAMVLLSDPLPMAAKPQ